MIPKLIIIVSNLPGRGVPGYVLYFETDIEEGETVVDADCEVMVRAPVVVLIENAEMDRAVWLPT